MNILYRFFLSSSSSSSSSYYYYASSSPPPCPPPVPIFAQKIFIAPSSTVRFFFDREICFVHWKLNFIENKNFHAFFGLVGLLCRHQSAEKNPEDDVENNKRKPGGRAWSNEQTSLTNESRAEAFSFFTFAI
ncbi:hypothetical protein T11_2549 [Trichinella zimbabwensis]|uniref:Uncharacterized protein n=1 Tax=Trichinella zimbabwensis TaxID=268475 RepID=A0A0V1I7W9_9BILA|nr:hypothetical protein T11_2549 [Trichinella zimbabwensis]